MKISNYASEDLVTHAMGERQMKIEKHTFERFWEGYLQAMENFQVIDLYAWRHIPIKRIEISIKDRP